MPRSAAPGQADIGPAGHGCRRGAAGERTSARRTGTTRGCTGSLDGEPGGARGSGGCDDPCATRAAEGGFTGPGARRATGPLRRREVSVTVRREKGPASARRGQARTTCGSASALYRPGAGSGSPVTATPAWSDDGHLWSSGDRVRRRPGTATDARGLAGAGAGCVRADLRLGRRPGGARAARRSGRTRSGRSSRGGTIRRAVPGARPSAVVLPGRRPVGPPGADRLRAGRLTIPRAPHRSVRIRRWRPARAAGRLADSLPVRGRRGGKRRVRGECALSEELVEHEVAQEQAFVDRVYVQLASVGQGRAAAGAGGPRARPAGPRGRPGRARRHGLPGRQADRPARRRPRGAGLRPPRPAPRARPGAALHRPDRAARREPRLAAHRLARARGRGVLPGHGGRAARASYAAGCCAASAPHA